MSCPVCDHTMQNLGTSKQRTFWCARCGTLKIDSGPGTHTEIENPIWIKNIIFAAGFMMTQYTTVKVSVSIEKHEKDPAIITAMEFQKC